MRQDSFLKRLISTIRCSICGRRYEASNVDILGHQDELWFVSVYCPACHTYGLVAAVIKEDATAEVITELSEEEYAKFAQGKAIDFDDVLDIHNFLKDFKGNPSELPSGE
jgi:hypothetical protein